MAKFGRNYSLLIEAADVFDSITITPPFTVEFDINRDYLTSANVAQIRIYNLSEKNRNNLRKDFMQFDNFRQISLKAGYGDNLPEILKGNITHAWSVREGNNFITSIEAFDAGFAFANAVTQTQYPVGTTQKTVITDLVQSLGAYNVSTGAVGDYPGTLARGNSYSGSTTEILRELTGGGLFIDNGMAHCLRDDECLDGATLLINKNSGLLGTPLLEQTITHVDILFEPNVKIGQRVQLDIRGAAFSGFYKVTSIHHRGMISQAVCGEVITSLGMVSGQFDPIAQVS